MHVCATQGRTCIKLAQQTMRRGLPADYYRLDGGRGSWNTRDLTADGIPGPNTQAALLWTVQRANVASLIGPVAADFDAYSRAAPEARGMPLSQGTCAALIWVAQNMQPDIGAYEFPAFVPPTWRLGSPDDGPEVVTCFSPSVIPTGGGASTPATSGGGAFNPYDLSSFGAASNLGPMIDTTTRPPATPPARKSKAGLIAAAAIGLGLAAAAGKKRKR